MRLKTLLILQFFVVSVQAASVDDLTFTLNGDSTGYAVSDCDQSASGSLDIPSTFDDLPVTSIGGWAFSDCTSLSSITIPDSVTSIGSRAFQNCTALTSLSIGSGLSYENISYYGLLNNCISLESIELNNANRLLCSSSGNPYDIGSNVGGSTNSSNYMNRFVTSVTIPQETKEIPSYAFKNCTLLNSIAIPEGVTSIGAYAFENCSGLTSLTIPDSVELLGNSAFLNCSGITSLVIGDGLRVIQRETFKNCANLSDISFGQNVNMIKPYAFLGCYSLSELTFNGYLYQIDSYAFQNCTQLRKVTFGEYLRYLDSYAFDGCFLLVEANFIGSPPVLDTNPFQYSPTTLYVDTDASGWGADFSYRPVFRKDMSSVDLSTGDSGSGSSGTPATTSAILDVYYSTDLATWDLMESIEVENPPAGQMFMKTELTLPSE